MRNQLLLAALTLVLALTCTASAHECPHRNVVGLFTRLAEGKLVESQTDSQIVGAFWDELKSTKDAAHENRLDAYASESGHTWVTLYAPADELWATLNSSDFRMREVFRSVVKEWRARKVQNGMALIEGRAREAFGRDDLCGCARP